MLLENPINKFESFSYLKLDNRPYHKCAYTFLYIGQDVKMINFLFGSFRNGFVSDNFSDARFRLFSLAEQGQSPDVIVLDNTSDTFFLREFVLSLRVKRTLNIPIIYNEKQFNGASVAFDHIDIIDDVIDLENFHFDISTKIEFLKAAKQYVQADEEPGARKVFSSYFNFLVKRTLDIILSAVLLIVLLPIFLLISILIKLESRGPIFYNSKRAGRGFKVFNFHKFRTMEVNADKQVEALAHLNQYDSNGGVKFFKISNDPRITKVGKFLRNSSLDELPQLFNVFKGEMSLVGNRPLPLYEAATLTTNESVERFMAPAGITGLWQIKKRGKAEMSAEERIGLDISYARRSNLIFDFWILAKTPGALFQKTNV
jgi:lipopolysaccharide/colanic/teichoic acid biosynthesis glycosyltransferase